MTFSTTIVTQRSASWPETSRPAPAMLGLPSSSCPGSRSTGRCGSPRSSHCALSIRAARRSRSTCPARVRASARSAVSRLRSSSCTPRSSPPVSRSRSSSVTRARDRSDVLRGRSTRCVASSTSTRCSTPRTSRRGYEHSNRSFATAVSRRSGRTSSPACIPNGLAPPAKRCCARHLGHGSRSCWATGRRCSRRHLRPRPIWPTRSRTCAPSRFRTRWSWVRSLTPRQRAWMAEHFPEANVVAIPNSGHFPHVAHPDAFARLLARTAP